ncbi:MAG TPA: hypothetical protein VEJ86_09755, partial [Candidatus Binataceae bacterium]|nr:hypothetical protein [Candidatus Binataceae bacterium]
KDIEKAHTLEREDANGLVEYGIVLRSRGSLNESIEVLRRAAAVGGREDIEYHLAVTLRERDEPGDLQEATELLMRSIARPDAIPAGDFPFAVAAAVEALAMVERYHDADALLSSITDGRLPEVTMRTLRANLRLAQGKFDQASKLADEALSGLTPDTTADTRRKLAALLHDLGRYRDALALWETLAAGGDANDTRRLLECATRLGRSDIMLDITRRTNPAAAEAAQETPEQEIERVERTDPEAALELMQAYIGEHPDDPVMRLRRSIVADRLGRSELLIAEPNSMPSPSKVAPSLGRHAVRIMRQGGRANEALAYAYEMLRRRPSDPDAHRGYLAAVGPVGPMPHIGDFDTALPGAAVCYVEQDTNVEHWAILEDSSDADETKDEFNSNHPLAKALQKRRVGDKFQLPEGRFSRKSATVKQILNKYAWRYQDVLAGWQKRFPGLPEIELAHRPNEQVTWSEMPEDFETLFGSATRSRDESLKEAGKVYAGNALPIHIIAEQLGLNDLQTMFIFAQRPDISVKCSSGAGAELEEALAAFEHANAVVIDLTAVATLCLLGKLGLLATWPRQFVIAQSTLTELRRLALDDTLLKLPPGFSASINGNGTDGKRTDVQLRGLADSLQTVCRVRDSGVLSAIDSDRRERLVRILGRHGAESVALAAMPGHVLWTDDRVLAGLAKTGFGVRRVWTEAAIQARVQSGCLDPAELATANTKLAGWGYTFTTPSVDTLMRAGSVAMWNPDQFPLRQALDQFATESIDLADATGLAAQLIVKVYNDAYLRGTRRSVTLRLLDRLAQRPGGRDVIEALPRSLPIRFGLDLIRSRELSDVARGWMAQNAVEPSPSTQALSA